MTNIVSNSVVWIGTDTNGSSAMVGINLSATFPFVAAIAVVVVSIVVLLVWLKKSK
jgi:hypothetical protein